MKFTKLNLGDIVAIVGNKGYRKLTKEPIVYGLFDEDDNLIASWDALVNTYGMDCEKEYALGHYNSDTSSPYYVLTNNSNLADGTKLVIADSVTSIGKYAFNECSFLTSITVPNSVNTLGYGAFYNCSSLISVNIPEGVTSIWCTFKGCSSLTSITIPDSVLTIDAETFYRCSALETVTLGGSVTHIGINAFYPVSSIKNVYFTGNIEEWCKIEFVNSASNPICCGANLYCNNELVTNVAIPITVDNVRSFAFYGCTTLKSVTIHDSVLSIGQEAFRNCGYIDSLTIGKSVTSIGARAFFYCSNLYEITFNGTIAQWNAITKGTDWNKNCPAGTVYCTDGTTTP